MKIPTTTTILLLFLAGCATQRPDSRIHVREVPRDERDRRHIEQTEYLERQSLLMQR